MVAAPRQTTPLDGWYRGVSREVLDGGSNEPRCYPRALTPPRGFSITDGVVRNPYDQWWEGIVGQQGALVIHSPRFSRVEGQIDPRGTIKGQYRGEVPSDLLAPIP